METCQWPVTAVMKKYHDEEWGVPVHDDRKHYEYLMLEALQCGLSWQLIMDRRDVIRKCFADFDWEKTAQYTEEDVERIVNTEGMIRSPRKVRAVIHDAQCFQRIRERYGSFDAWLWSFTDGKTILYNGHEEGGIPASNGLSDRIAKQLKQYGFKYLGTVTVYAYLQACGVINDHQKDCPCYTRIIEKYPCVRRRRYLEK